MIKPRGIKPKQVINGKSLCPHCDRWLELKSGFHRTITTTTGYSSWCKECRRKDIAKNGTARKKKERLANPLRFRAKELVHRAVKSGKLEKLPCEICQDKNSQAHHFDYNKPLRVVWFCDLHHKKIHLVMRQARFTL
jgi:hypothetical protein